MSNKEKIVELIKKEGQQTIKELADKLEISSQMVHRHVKDLISNKLIKKVGSAPFVFYILFQTEKVKYVEIDNENKKIIEENFLFISPQGKRFDGIEGFSFWCEKRGFDLEKKAKEYIEIYKKYDHFKNLGVIFE
jgi:DNA-binding Lrp family transcriptional regulator